MHHLKTIRERLGVTQHTLAKAIGCTQGNIGHYERGQTLPPAVAAKVIRFAADCGLVIGYDHIYGDAPLPGAISTAPATQSEERAHA